MDWDVATILDALDELFPVQAEHRHPTLGYRWEAVVTEARSNVVIPQGDMEQVRQDTLIKWNRAMINLGPVPDNIRLKITKGLAGCFTHRDNPHGNSARHMHFQRELHEMIEGEELWKNPTVERLCGIVAKLILQWEQTQQRFLAQSGTLGSSSSSSTLGKHSRHPKSTDTANKHAKATDNEELSQ